MATIIRLEKDGYMKDAFVGYSYTTAFFNAFVPAARQDLKTFLYLGGFYFLKIFILEFYKIYEQRNFGTYKYYTFIIFISFIIPWSVAFFYNKYYTQKMLADGWKPLKDDEYSNTLLKAYNYLEYVNSDLISDERTKEILDEVKKIETKKALLFTVVAIVTIIYYCYF